MVASVPRPSMAGVDGLLPGVLVDVRPQPARTRMAASVATAPIVFMPGSVLFFTVMV
jgi:hypothetical protein